MFFAKFVFFEVSSKTRESLSSWKPRCLQNISSEKTPLYHSKEITFLWMVAPLIYVIIYHYHDRNTTLLPSVVNVEGMLSVPDRCSFSPYFSTFRLRLDIGTSSEGFLDMHFTMFILRICSKMIKITIINALFIFNKI